MRVLVTGVAGFIGSHLAEGLVRRGDVVVGIDNFDPFYARADKERNLAAVPGLRFVEGDVRSAADLDRAIAVAGGVDVVVHLAALAGVRASLREPARYYDVNVGGTAAVIEACARADVDRIVLASSSSVYGRDSRAPFHEDDACAAPLSPYAASKRGSELVGFAAAEARGAVVTCLRFFTAYGPRQRPDLAIAKFTERLLRGDAIELYGDGGSRRDYTYVDDLVAGTLAAVDRTVAGPAGPRFRIYNLGGGRAVALSELVACLAAVLGRPARLVHLPDQPGEMHETLADLTRSERELGYRPRVALEDGLARFVAWRRAQDG